MSSLTLHRRALATLCATALVVASAIAAPLFVNAPASAHGPVTHGPVKHGPQPDRRPFRVGRPVSYKNLTLFPVHGRVTPPPTNDYVTLDEGLRAGTVVITERGGERRMVRRRGRRGARQVQVRNDDEGGDSVNELALINRSGKKLLLLGGEVIVGGKQDRIVEEDLIVPAVSIPVSLSVFCVEHGRWSNRAERAAPSVGSGGGGSAPVQAASETVEVTAQSAPVEVNVSGARARSNGVTVTGARNASAAKPETFSSLGAISHPKLRAAAQDKKEQGEVWNEVSANNVRLNTTNTTDTYQSVYESEEVRATMDEYVAALQRELAGTDVVGVVVARGGELIWVDQFASPSLFRRYWPKLLKSYVVEALGGPASERRPGVDEAQRYLDERSGDAKSTVKAGVYELTKLESPRYAVFELWDISLSARLRLHYNKMQR